MGLALGIIMFALGLGVGGYHFIAGLPWVDALLNASMILAGMGPVDLLRSNAAKLFASFYALFSGVVFISLMVCCCRRSRIACCTSFTSAMRT